MGDARTWTFRCVHPAGRGTSVHRRYRDRPDTGRRGTSRRSPNVARIKPDRFPGGTTRRPVSHPATRPTRNQANQAFVVREGQN